MQYEAHKRLKRAALAVSGGYAGMIPGAKNMTMPRIIKTATTLQTIRITFVVRL